MPPKVLIVDDDQDLRGLLDVRLRASGYATAFAADAIGVVAAARRERPDLILLDIGLPAGDGFLVMDRLRAIPALSHVPVIVVTARDPAATRSPSLERGAVAFFQKPFDAGELLSAVESTLATPA